MNTEHASPQPGTLVSTARRPVAFQESWVLRVVHPQSARSVWFRFSTLRSSNGYRRTAEVLALVSQRNVAGVSESKFLRNTFDLSEFSPKIQIGNCSLTDAESSGHIHYKNHELRWNLQFSDKEAPLFRPYSEVLSRLGILHHHEVSEFPKMLCSGKIEIDGQTLDFSNSIAFKVKSSGTRNPDQWVRAQCNSFFNEQNEPVDALFEGITCQTRFPFGIQTPWISSFMIRYQGKPYLFNDLWQSFRSRSERSLNEWSFQIDKGELSFRGQVSASHKDFVGLIFEDTDETLHHSSFSQLAEMTLLVYRKGKLESTLLSKGTASFEVVSRERNPYLTAIT